MQRLANRHNTVSIHASRMEGDVVDEIAELDDQLFQSTPPGWRATRLISSSAHWKAFQSTPPGWRATSLAPRKAASNTFQSTPPGWRATSGSLLIPCNRAFQSTPPGWRATEADLISYHETTVSIHASRMEGDAAEMISFAPCTCFNPRLPDGGRHGVDGFPTARGVFQSTPPGWRATRRSARLASNANRFNPRLPDGGRHEFSFPADSPSVFQSTPPGWRATRLVCSVSRRGGFQSTPPGWRATRFWFNPLFLRKFQSTPRGLDQ